MHEKKKILVLGSSSCFALPGGKDVLLELAGVVPGGVVVAHVDVALAAAVADGASKLLGVLPDHLGEVAGGAREAWVVVVVQISLLVPGHEGPLDTSVAPSEVLSVSLPVAKVAVADPAAAGELAGPPPRGGLDFAVPAQASSAVLGPVLVVERQEAPRSVHLDFLAGGAIVGGLVPTDAGLALVALLDLAVLDHWGLLHWRLVYGRLVYRLLLYRLLLFCLLLFCLLLGGFLLGGLLLGCSLVLGGLVIVGSLVVTTIGGLVLVGPPPGVSLGGSRGLLLGFLESLAHHLELLSGGLAGEDLLQEHPPGVSLG